MKSKFTWIFTLFMAFFIQFSFAQEKTITGVVTDPMGMPIPGVIVRVQGASAPGVQTDFDGRYTLQASVGQKIEFSYVGMKTQVQTVGNSNTVSVQMTDDTTILEDVIVTSYRTTTKPLSNDAVTTITSKTIEGRPNASFIQTLQSQVPGLNISTGSGQPGSSSTVILRGYGSVNGSVEPLYVIDGVPMSTDNFRSINPNDIESISVLKDAGATAIYGNRGANGVIVVRTKRGNYESPLRIKYTGITSFTEMQNNKYNVMSSRQLLGLENRVGSGYGATLTEEEIANYDGPNTNWKDVLFRTGVSQNHTLNLTSGGKNLSSFTSLGYFDQEGILEKTDLKRFSFRNNMTGKSDDGRFDYATAVTVNFSRRNEAINLGQGSVNLNPVVGANNGVPYLSPGQYTNGADLLAWYQGTLDDESITNGVSSTGTLLLTPLLLLNHLDTYINRTDEIKSIGNVRAGYKITDDLSVGGSFGMDFTENTRLAVGMPDSFTELLFAGQGQQYLGSQTEIFERIVNLQANTNINYTKVFAEKHTIDASVFTEYYKAHIKSFSYTQNGLDTKVFSPGAGTGFIAYDGSPFYVPSVSARKSEAGLFSYFGTFDYDYAGKYGLGASVRRDASYRFGSTNRWGTFWSVDARWNLNEEAFMSGSKFSLLKLRASFGTSGNQNIFGESVFNAPNFSRTLIGQFNSYENTPAYGLTQLGNNNLQWETIQQANVGIDFEVFDSKLRGSVDGYIKTTQDLYLDTYISAVSGTNTINGNFGELENKGVEAQIAYDVFRTDDFTLTLNFNGSYNKNKLLDIADLSRRQEFDLQILAEGHPLNEYYLIPYVGVNPATGNLLFKDSEGNLTENPNPDTDKRFTDKTFFPKFQGGFGFDANYKGFFLTTQFSYVADIWRFDYDLEGLQDVNDIGVFNKTTDLLRAWTEDNRVTDIPSLNYTNKSADAFSDRYLKDASYVRLRYSSIGYNFNSEMLEKTPLTGLRAYFQAENLFTLTKWRGWDAESPRASDVYQYPTPRILSLGLEVEF